MIDIPKSSKRHFFTPLRYPGGKTFLSEFFGQTIRRNQLSDVLYIEPYAGGAGAALALLMMEKVDHIVINDLDKAIYSFWRSVTEYASEFIEMIRSVSVDIDEWRKQCGILRSSDSTDIERGFATFFLNRTNHSGIITGGPIGGTEQNGNWKLDARFNRDSLIKKIRLISRYSERITVSNIDGVEILSKYADDSKSFFYIDPPYYVKGGSLYLNAYKHDDHVMLSERLNLLTDTNWILSYDNVEVIKNLYIDRRNKFEFSLHYQARESRRGSEILVLSDSLTPPFTNVVRSS